MPRRPAWDSPLFEAWFKEQLEEDADGCLIWHGRDSRVSCHLRYGPQSKQKQPHQVAFILAHGRPPLPGLGVLHKCDKHNCCNPKCLYEGTPQQNVDDMMKRGRWVGNYYQQGKGPHNSIGTKRTPEQRKRLSEAVKASIARRKEAQGG